MQRLIEKRPEPPAFPLQNLRIQSVRATVLGFSYAFTKHHEALKEGARRRAEEARRMNRRASYYTIYADDTVK